MTEEIKPDADQFKDNTISQEWLDFWYSECYTEADDPVNRMDVSKLKEAQGNLLPCEANNELIRLLQNAIDRATEAQAWLYQAQRWLNMD